MYLPKGHNTDSHEGKKKLTKLHTKATIITHAPHAHTRPRKRTIIALGLLRELGQVDITLSFLLCSHAGRFLLARCDADPRKNAETHTGSQEAANSSPATMYKQRRRRTRNEESAAQSAKWPAAEQELLHSVRPAAPTALPPCNTNSVTTLQPYRPTTLPPPSANQGKKNRALFTLPRVTLQFGLSLSLFDSL